MSLRRAAPDTLRRALALRRMSRAILVALAVAVSACDPPQQSPAPAAAALAPPPSHVQPSTEAQRAAWREALHAHDGPSQLRALQELATAGPWSVERVDATLWLARLHTDAGRERAALALLEILVREGPPHPDALVAVARERLRGGQLDEAEELLLRAHAVDPYRLDALIVLARLFHRRELPEEADAWLLRWERAIWVIAARIDEHLHSPAALPWLARLDQGERDPRLARVAMAATSSRDSDVRARAHAITGSTLPEDWLTMIWARSQDAQTPEERAAWRETWEAAWRGIHGPDSPPQAPRGR